MPKEISERAKTGFGTPVDRWLQKDNRLQDWRRVRSLTESYCPWARRWAYQLATNWRGSFRISNSGYSEKTSSLGSIIIFRIGSIGDTICALPCFHKIASLFSNYRRVLLTDIPTRSKGAPVEAIIGNSGLVDEILYFSANNRTVVDLLKIRQQIKRTGAKTLIYIADRSLLSTLRDIVFFYGCGIRKIIGAPLVENLRFPQVDPVTGQLEHEAERLVRCLADLGKVDLSSRAYWDLRLTPAEISKGAKALGSLGARQFIAVNLGGKVAAKDWGDANWKELLLLMFSKYRDHGLVFFGSSDEWDRCEKMGALWEGAVVNLCGVLTPRESAAALKQAKVFIGHDSGPMHLASVVDVPCVCMFGNYNAPKRWHPYGSHHRVIHNMKGLEKISPQEAFAEVQAVLDGDHVVSDRSDMALV